MAGGSQPRSHSQVYLDLCEDGYGVWLDSIIRSFNKKGEGVCWICDNIPRETLVIDNEYWISWATLPPRRNLQLRLAPRRHVSRLGDLNLREMKVLSRNLIMLFKGP